MKRKEDRLLGVGRELEDVRAKQGDEVETVEYEHFDPDIGIVSYGDWKIQIGFNVKAEYLKLVNLQTGQERKSFRSEVTVKLIKQLKPVLDEVIKTKMPVQMLGSGWWLKACESADVNGELRNMYHAVLRVGFGWNLCFGLRCLIHRLLSAR